MQHITDQMVDRLVSSEHAQRVLRQAFMQFGEGRAAMQARVRTDAAGVKLSTLGAVIPEQGVVGAKVYTTINGKFNFVILLFSAATGLPLATLDAGAITRLRTAACSVLMAQSLAPANSKILGLFGAGTQGIEHAIQFSKVFSLDAILVSDPHGNPDKLRKLSELTGVTVASADSAEIANSADIVVTASRSQVPLFKGCQLKHGAFVAAIGSSLPHTRELDDQALARASAVIVEWRPQSMSEAGDLVLADSKLKLDHKVIEVADVLSGKCSRSNPDQLFIYKSVGVGLEDIALAGYAYERFNEKKEAA